MPLTAFTKWARLRKNPEDGRCTEIRSVSAQTEHAWRPPEHPCDARCPIRRGRGGAVCSRIAHSSADETMGRAGFLRGLGTLAGVTALGSMAGSLSGLFSLPAKAMAAGKAARGAAGGGLWLGNAGNLTPAQALTYTDPGSGDPALLMRLANGRYVSFDAGCTHGTCTVAYDTRRRLMVCPCHGATFDPAKGAAVLVGPAKDPLYPLPIRVDASGNVYYLDAQPGPRVNRLKKAPPYTGQTGDDGSDGEDGTGHGSNADAVRIRPLRGNTNGRHRRSAGDE